MDIKLSVKKILNSAVFQNGMWLYAMQMFNSVIPLLTLPYITRVLGAAGYGLFSKVFNIIGYYQVVVEFGFHMSGARKAALIQDRDEMSNVFTSIVFARAVLCSLCFLTVVVYALFVSFRSAELKCFLCLSLVPLGTALQQNWLFQGMQKMKYITIISVVSRLLSLAGIFLFVHIADDVYLYCVLYSVTSICTGFAGIFVATTKMKLRFTKAGIANAWNETKEAWYVFTTSLSSKVFTSFGVTVLAFFASDAEIGIYSAIQKIPNIIMLAWTPITQILYPISSQRMTASFLEGKKSIFKLRKFFLLAFSMLAAGISVFSKQIIQILYGEEYAASYYLVYPLLIWLLLGINNNFLGIQVLLGGGYAKEYSSCFQVSVVVMVLLDLSLIWLFKSRGAALAPALSEFVLYILLRRKIKMIEKGSALKAPETESEQ